MDLHSFFLNLIKIFICAFFLLEISYAGPFEDQIILFCKGQDILSDFPDDLSKVQPDDFPRLYLNYLSFIEKSNKFIEKYSSKIDLDKLTKVERIFSVLSLMAKRSKNFNQMERLLDFKTESNDLNSYRLAYLGYVKALQGQFEISYNLTNKAYKIRTELDPFLYQMLLYTYLNDLYMNINTSDKKTKYVFGEVKKISKNNPLKLILEAYIKIFQTNYIYDETTLSLIKKAYSQCPDFTIYDYVRMLYHKYELEKALKVLNEIIHSDPYYLPETDLLMAEILVLLNDYEKAKIFFKKAKEAKPYFLGTSDSTFDYIESTLNSHKNKDQNQKNRYIFWIFILIASLVFTFFLIWWILRG